MSVKNVGQKTEKIPQKCVLEDCVVKRGCPHVFPGDFFSQKMSSLVIPCSTAPGICEQSEVEENSPTKSIYFSVMLKTKFWQFDLWEQ